MSRTYRRAILATCVCLSVIAAALASAAGAGPAPTPAGAIDRELLGMVVRDPWYDFGTSPDLPDQPNQVSQEHMGAILEQAGVRWVRFEFFVAGDDPAALDRTFARYDFFVNEVAPRHGLKVLGLLSFGVVSETGPLDKDRGIIANQFADDPTYGGGVNPYIKRWLDRALGIANHYQGAVAAYEVLNEQNRLPSSGQAVPAYLAARLHTKFYRQIKAPAIPDGAAWRDSVKVIVGGLHPKGTLEKGQADYLSDTDYLRQLYGYYYDQKTSTYILKPSDPFPAYLTSYGTYPLDGLGYHPYPEEIRLSAQADAELIDTRLTAIRSVLGDVNDIGRHYWITEVGYNTAFKQQDEAGQAAFMRAVYTGMASRGDVDAIFWFKYEDFPPASGPDAQRWGIVSIPFTVSATCPGGACYDAAGNPSAVRLAFFTYRELAGLPVYRAELPLVMR
ncbi:MAG: hypothetical protein WCI67_01905 [Chloroflexales bacterium]